MQNNLEQLKQQLKTLKEQMNDANNVNDKSQLYEMIWHIQMQINRELDRKDK